MLKSIRILTNPVKDVVKRSLAILSALALLSASVMPFPLIAHDPIITIASFNQLDDEVLYQTVYVGIEKTDINLPTHLTADVEKYQIIGNAGNVAGNLVSGDDEQRPTSSIDDNEDSYLGNDTEEYDDTDNNNLLSSILRSLMDVRSNK